ncbi:SMI1/KNR4 family protein [Bacillus kwashiorkori]|uniref:SMI1/KNR4 family protein n=1 Tax=Bacillus kwashiorkori TaxID=1522318 RepID=UPI00078448E5|nr:SMI1/KNR4 family protein [Bacillus kwashiorkori]
MREEIESKFHGYEVPQQIYQLIDLEEKLNKRRLSLSQIGFSPDFEQNFYSITPPDFIPFASTGGDGICFGFLTDFGIYKDLTEAPVVCVTPTNDPPLRLVARNLREFLNIAYSVPFVELLEMFWEFEKAEQVQEVLTEVEKDTGFLVKRNRGKIFRALQQTFQLEKIDVLDYLKTVKREREQSIIIPTMDGLGVACPDIPFISYNKYAFNLEAGISDSELERMKNFIKKANKLEKLAFVRDANYRYILTKSDDWAVLELVIDLLESLSLFCEAKVMEGE